MRGKLLLGGAVLLLVAGIWIGRATQSTAKSATQTDTVVSSSLTSTRAAEARVAAVAMRPPAIQRPAVSPDLAADLKDANPKVRATAVRDAIEEGGDAEVFRTAVRDRALEVGIAGAGGLGKLHASGEVSAQEMIAIVTDRSLNERVRVETINGLGLVPSADAARALADMVHRGDTVEKRSAAILLVHQDSEIAVPALIDALGDADERVRANAAEALRGKSRGRDFGTDAGAWRAWWQSRSR